MPAWNRKDERQYEHIKESALERGANEDEESRFDRGDPSAAVSARRESRAAIWDAAVRAA